MKAAIATVLIVCGTLLVLAPAGFDYLFQLGRQQVRVARPEAHSVT